MTAMTFDMVIEQYLMLVQEVIRRIESRYGVATPSAVRARKLPAAGNLNGMAYQFHGRGCTAELDGQTVSWDWWEGRIDILDPWQIAQLTGEQPEMYGEWSNHRHLRQHMQALADQGVLESVFGGASYQRPAHRGSADAGIQE